MVSKVDTKSLKCPRDISIGSVAKGNLLRGTLVLRVPQLFNHSSVILSVFTSSMGLGTYLPSGRAYSPTFLQQHLHQGLPRSDRF